MRRIARAAAVLSIVGAIAIAASVPAAGQEADADDEVLLAQSYLDAYGWWSKAQQNPVGGQLPNAPADTSCRPTDVNACPAGPPADGIYIVYDYEAVVPPTATGPVNNLPAAPTPPPQESAPNVAPPQPLGPIAYGAVRYVVPEGADTELTLHVLSRSSTQPGGVDATVGKLFACASATPGWAAAQNGRYDQGPTPDCTTADEGEFNGDSVTFKLSPTFVAGTTLEAVIIGAGDAASGGQPFQMALAAPANESLMILNATELVDESLLAEEDYSFEDPLTSFEEYSIDEGPASDYAVATDGEYLAAPRVPVARPQSQRGVTAGRIVNPFSPDAGRGERLMAVALLLAMAAALWWLGGQPARAPRLLGPLAQRDAVEPAPVPTGGIGRFARPRHGSPPRLF